MAEPNLLSTAINIFAAPREAFAAIRARPVPGFPLLLILVGLVVVTVLYLNLVDLAWFLEGQIRSSPAADQLTEAQIQAAVDRSSGSPAFLSTISAISSSIIVTLLYLIIALYLWVVSKIGKHGIGFVLAFALVCWSSLPGLLGFVASIVNLLANDASFMQRHMINPLSFGALFSIEPTSGSVAQQVLAGVDLTIIWAAFLMVIGYQCWSGKSLAVAGAIVLAPYALLFGIAAASAMN